MTGGTERSWLAGWEAIGVADAIERYWLATPDEAAHRDTLVDLVVQHLASPRDSVLEVGCGTGLIYSRLVPAHVVNSSYVGVDLAEAMLRVARANHPAGQFVHGDGRALRFNDAAFDVTLCFEVVGHLPEIGAFLGELLRVTRRQCLFSVWPSPDADVVEGYETIEGVRFLRRSYSDAYVRSMLAPYVAADHVQAATISGECWVYIVRKDALDVSKAPPIVPFASYRSRLVRAFDARAARITAAAQESIAALTASLRALPDHLALRHAAERERDAAQSARETAERERDAVQRACDTATRERDRAQTAGETAERERDAVRRERDEAAHERDRAQSARETAERERDAAQRARDTAAHERDRAQAARETAERERNAAQRAREVAERARDAALSRVEGLATELHQTHEALTVRSETVTALEAQVGAAHAKAAAHAHEAEEARAHLVAEQAEMGTLLAALSASQAGLDDLGQRAEAMAQIVHARDAEISDLHGALGRATEVGARLHLKTMALATEVEAFRERRAIRWVDRLQYGADLSQWLDPAFQALHDDSLLFNPDLRRFALRPSPNLQIVAFLAYPLGALHHDLSALFLAPILTVPASPGALGIEIVVGKRVIAESQIPLDRIDERLPTRFPFPLVPATAGEPAWLRVFVRDTTHPVRVFEWQRPRRLWWREPERRAFAGFLFTADPGASG